MTTNSKDNGFAIALQNHFPGLHGARRKFLEKVIPAIVKASSVKLGRIATAFDSAIQQNSIVRRIQRIKIEWLPTGGNSLNDSTTIRCYVSFANYCLMLDSQGRPGCRKTHTKFGEALQAW